MDTLEKLNQELMKARKSYAECGCTIYLDRINEITAQIKDLEKVTK